MAYTYAKLKGRIVEKFGTQKAFADAIGISENSMSKKLNGLTGFSQEDIVLWSEKLEIDLREAGKYFFA